ncbi:hypothetical protein RFI_26498 [Reticulomyxa filosa]|uniref:Uncharacterized protein n=1 Tax=Reticulomyxa filosa TaxID=46433 RepID=X6MAL6_RETFI|nr:hypothetical protein RFI_26498 [Reticulomyxa filosa]|eukprot:ETO10879.1 hypothetical protein RFI_26498 [Reticulomyxa filosa]
MKKIREIICLMEYKFFPILSHHQSNGSIGKTHDEDSKIEAKTNEDKQAELANGEGGEGSSVSLMSIKGVRVLTQDEKQEVTRFLQNIEPILNDNMSESLNLTCMKLAFLILMQDYKQALNIATPLIKVFFFKKKKGGKRFFFKKKIICLLLCCNQLILKHDPDNEDLRIYTKYNIKLLLNHWIKILHIKFGWVNEFDNIVINYVSSFILSFFKNINQNNQMFI